MKQFGKDYACGLLDMLAADRQIHTQTC